MHNTYSNTYETHPNCGPAAGLGLYSWDNLTQFRWIFQHVAELVPTARISRGDNEPGPLPTQYTDLSDVGVQFSGVNLTTVKQVIQHTETNGWMVVHDGVVLVEEYFGEMTACSHHLLMSISKSLIGAVTGVLAGHGVLDLSAEAAHYIPALRASGYAGATVRHLLDMRSGITFSENYLDAGSEVRRLEQSVGWVPRQDPTTPVTMYEFLLSLTAETNHGGPFQYRSCETDVLGWIGEAATGIRMPELMSEVLWSRLGAEADATITVDPEGTGMFDGGISTCLRDLARFGVLFLNEGSAVDGQQVIPPAWIDDTLRGGHDSRSAFAASTDDLRMPGGMYRNQMWFPYRGNNILLCLGIHGQMVYVNRAASLVAVKLSNWPIPQSADRFFATLNAFDAIAASL